MKMTVLVWFVYFDWLTSVFLLWWSYPSRPVTDTGGTAHSHKEPLFLSLSRLLLLICPVRSLLSVHWQYKTVTISVWACEVDLINHY